MGRLGDAPLGPTPLTDAVADALGDPSATVAYWLPAEQRYVDASGAAVEPGSHRSVDEVVHDGSRVGAIVYDRRFCARPSAMPMAGGPAIADPFKSTSAFVSLLGLCAAQMRGFEERRESRPTAAAAARFRRPVRRRGEWRGTTRLAGFGAG